MQCDTCHGGCCRAYDLIITIADILKISRELGLSPEEFVAIEERATGEIGVFEAKNPGLLFNEEGCEGKLFFITLRRVDSKLIPNTLRCLFLNEWERSETVHERGDHPGAKIVGRCGIRPLMCRAYPSSLDTTGVLSYLRKPPESSLSESHGIYKLCPENWTAADFSNSADDAIHNLTLERYEWSFQRRVIEKWNTAPRSRSEFFPVMEKVYAARLLATGERWSELFEVESRVDRLD